jgi:uncharacterized cupin superfamily protein
MECEKERPPFILATNDIDEVPGKYPDKDEVFSFGRAVGYAAGLRRIRFHVERLPPGHRTDLPHALRDEEEFYFVQEGQVAAWIDGVLFTMKPGDLAGFPSGTAIAHTFINNGDEDAIILVGGERRKLDGRIYYPEVNPQELDSCAWIEEWGDVPKRALGPDDSRPRGKPALASASIGLRDGIHACKNQTQRTRGF